MAKKSGDAQQDAAKIDRVVKQHDYAGAECCADGARVFKSERSIEFFRRNKSPGRTAQTKPPANLPCRLRRRQDRSASRKSRANRRLRRRPDERCVRRGKIIACRQNCSVPSLRVCRAAFENDAGNVDERLDVVDDCGLAE